jgi:hypothetical protein
MEVMLGLLSADEQPWRLLTQLPFDEAPEQMQKPVSVDWRQLLPPTAR